MFIESSAPFEAIFETGVSGQVGTVAVKVIDNDGINVIGPTTTNITEDGTSGIYIWNAPAAPATVGQYTIVWSLAGTFAADSVTVDELVVVSAGVTLPPLPPPTEGGLGSGPCSAWTTASEVIACCASLDVGSDLELVDDAIAAASELLYLAGGKQHAGLCQRTVRPCRTDSCNCGYQVLSRGHLVGWNGDCWGGYHCGCRAVSRIKLAGTVRSIVEVMIDGIVIDPSEYKMDEETWLTRKNGARWPSCQSMDVDDDAVGAFTVTYTFGRTPPGIAQQAARQLACEVAKSCSSDPNIECALPIGVTRVTRQGITIERTFMQRDRDGVWSTGLPLVDLYLNTYNPRGIPRRATFWSPSSKARYARRSP